MYQREPLSRFANIIAATLSILLVSSFVILAFCYVRPFYQLSAAQLRDAGIELKKLTPPGAEFAAHLRTDAMPIEATPEFKIYKLTPKHAIVIPSEVEESGRLTAR